jgi:tyrosyl-tRNA synthetase
MVTGYDFAYGTICDGIGHRLFCRDVMTRLGDSVVLSLDLLTQDLSSDHVVLELLTETHSRRRLDLSDLAPAEQASLIASRAVDTLPTAGSLAAAIAEVRAAGRGLIVKLGIDPTSADVHLGHAVPMILLSRFQRMGHQVVLIIGDITAKIGDPSGRTGDRPPLADSDIACNLATYREQVAPFFDFSRADLKHNSEWLAQVRLPELLEILAQIPVSVSLQREDFRTRLAQGYGLSMSEFIYAVVMAIDSVKIHADIELGGVDQLLNMQMGRKVMEISDQKPQLVVTVPLVEGTDGSGKKMSKSLGNYVALTAAPDDIFGKIMSIPDRLTAPYLMAWTEWTDTEITHLTERIEKTEVHPMDAKKILAGEAVAAIHGVDVAMAARETFTARFSRRSFADVDGMPVLDLATHGEITLGGVLTQTLGLAPSTSAVRRIAKQNGLRLVFESSAGQDATILDEAAVMSPLQEVVAGAFTERRWQPEEGTAYLKAGRAVARIAGR